MNLAYSVATGSTFLDTFTATEPATVLFCHGELDSWMAHERWKAMTGTSAPPDRLLESFDPFRLRVVRRRISHSEENADGGYDGYSDDYLEARIDEGLERAIVKYGIDLVILDPIAVYYGGKENSNDEMEAALSKVRQLSLRYGTTFLLVHHFGKMNERDRNGNEPEDNWRGASRLGDWASTRITMLPHYRHASAQKQGMSRVHERQYVDLKFLRRAEPVDDFSIRLDVASGTWHRWDAPQAEAARTRAPSSPQQVLAALRETGPWRSTRQAAKGLGCAAHTAKKRLAEAERQGLIVREVGHGDNGGDLYRLADPA